MSLFISKYVERKKVAEMGAWQAPRALQTCPERVPDRCRANMSHIRQSRPDSELGFQVQVLKSSNNDF